MYPSERHSILEEELQRRERRRRTCEMCGGPSGGGVQYCVDCDELLQRSADLDQSLKSHEKEYVDIVQNKLMDIVTNNV